MNDNDNKDRQRIRGGLNSAPDYTPQGPLWPIIIVGLLLLAGIVFFKYKSAPETQDTKPVTQEITSIYWSDGDSGRITFASGESIPFRINDKDAPETGGVGAAIGGAKCEKERELGFATKEWVVKYTRGAQLVITGDYGQDRYDSKSIDISVNQQDLGDYGTLLGHYRSWKHDGKKALEPRPVWCG